MSFSGTLKKISPRVFEEQTKNIDQLKIYRIQAKSPEELQHTSFRIRRTRRTKNF